MLSLGRCSLILSGDLLREARRQAVTLSHNTISSGIRHPVYTRTGQKPLHLPHTMCHTYFIETFGAGCNSRPTVERVSDDVHLARQSCSWGLLSPIDASS